MAVKSPAKPKPAALSSAPIAQPILYPQELVPIGKIVDDGKNPRLASKADAAKFEELVASVKVDGIKQPILVYLEGGKFHVVFGNRRRAAAAAAGWKEIPAMVMDHVPQEAEKQRLRAIENLNRQDLNKAEEALVVVQMFEATGTVEATAKELQRPEQWVRDRLYLQRLCVKVRDLLASGRINLGQARELAKMGDIGDQVDVAETIALAAPGEKDRWSGVKVYSVDEVRGMVENKKRSLKVVQWKLESAFAGKPACVGCKDNTATDRTLFGTSDEEAEKGCCMNQGCFETKAKAVVTVQAKAVTKVREQVKKKEISKEDAGGVAVAREQSPEWIKPESVQRVVKKELGLNAPVAKKEGGKAAPVKDLTEKEKRQQAFDKWGRSLDDWRNVVMNEVEKKADGDPYTRIAYVFLVNCTAIRKLDYRCWVGREKAAPPASPKLTPAAAHLIDLAMDRKAENLLEIAQAEGNDLSEIVDSYTEVPAFDAETTLRWARAFGVEVKTPSPVFEDCLPEELKPKKKAVAPAAAEKPAPGKPANLDLMEEALDQALHAIAGSLGRWIDRQDRGLDDAELAAAIGEEWKGNPGFSGGDYGYETKGGKKIGFLFNERAKKTAQAPMLEGKALVERVRKLLEIPQPQGAVEKIPLDISRVRVLKPVSPGVCSACGCTEEDACEGGCSWADREQTLCSECVPIHAGNTVTVNGDDIKISRETLDEAYSAPTIAAGRIPDPIFMPDHSAYTVVRIQPTARPPRYTLQRLIPRDRWTGGDPVDPRAGKNALGPITTYTGVLVTTPYGAQFVVADEELELTAK